MLRSVAHYADAWNAFFAATGNSPEGIRPLRDKVDAACNDAGRDPATLERTCTVLVGFDLPGAIGHPQTKNLLTGSAEEIAEGLRAYGREGIGHIQVYLDPMTSAGIAAFAPVIEELT